MAEYTMELRAMAHNNNVFTFDYDFYDEDLKPKFEQTFIEHYFFEEIGFETIDKFKYRLRARLNEIMPYYKQLYATELASKEVNFLLNKDLKETFIREIDNLNTTTSNVDSNSNSILNSTGTGINSDTPEGSINDIEKYMSNASKSDNTDTSEMNGTSKADSTSEGKGKEKTELLSQGNIGITSSGSLLEDWRKVLININQLIINECQDLFMLVY